MTYPASQIKRQCATKAETEERADFRILKEAEESERDLLRAWAEARAS